MFDRNNIIHIKTQQLTLMKRDALFSRLTRILLKSNSYRSMNDYQFDTNSDELKLYSTNDDSICEMEKRYAELLEVPISSTLEAKRSAYRKLCLRYHPDKFMGDNVKKKAANELIIQLNEAINYFEKRTSK